jgi:hypothetical protein
MASTLKEYVISPLTLYYAPVATALPAATLAYGAAWPSGWVALGAQKEGAKLSYSFEEFAITNQQARGAKLGVRRHSETAMLEAVLAGYTKDNLMMALSGKSITSTAATSTVNGVEVIGVGGAGCLPVFMFGFEGEIVDDECQESYYLRVIFRKGVIQAGFESEFKFDDYAAVPVKIEALMDMSQPVNERLMRIEMEIPATND